jgi:hypothetical protein
MPIDKGVNPIAPARQIPTRRIAHDGPGPFPLRLHAEKISAEATGARLSAPGSIFKALEELLLKTLLCLKTPRQHPGFIAGPTLKWRLSRLRAFA